LPLEVIVTAKSEWNAWYNEMGHPNVLHVVGKVDVGSTDHGYTLVKTGEEESNPPNLLLQLNYHTIIAPRPAGDHVIEVRFTEEAGPGKYGRIKVSDESGKLVAEITDITIAT
jgi:hypothetical protein